MIQSTSPHLCWFSCYLYTLFYFLIGLSVMVNIMSCIVAKWLAKIKPRWNTCWMKICYPSKILRLEVDVKPWLESSCPQLPAVAKIMLDITYAPVLDVSVQDHVGFHASIDVLKVSQTWQLWWQTAFLFVQRLHILYFLNLHPIRVDDVLCLKILGPTQVKWCQLRLRNLFEVDSK